MRIAITGGTGFVGRSLARDLTGSGHKVVIIARGVDKRDERVRDLAGARFVAVSTDDQDHLAEAFAGCDAVAHCAGINREQGSQTYERVHLEGTRNVVAAAERAGVRKIILLSFLQARPDCGSPYHETKWAAEELVRGSGLDYTIIKAGMMYGKGDHMLDHISHTLRLLPVFATVGFTERTVRPVAVEDVVRVMHAALIDGRLSGETVAVVGPEELGLSQVVRRVGRVMGKRVLVLPSPIFFQRILAWTAEHLMKNPVVTRAQVQMLSEGISMPMSGSGLLPDDLLPQVHLSDDQIRRGLPQV